MAKLLNSIPITSIAKTITDVMGIDSPKNASSSSQIVVNAANNAFHAAADKVFMYNPDGIALWLFQKYTYLFEKAILNTSLQLPVLSVMPSVTPVCFASMYTGAMPSVHGIEAYEKPVLTSDTVFDCLIRAGKKAAIVSTAGDSISVIFLDREMDYFIYDTVEECNKKAFELIKEDKHDLIVLYNANYDSTMHKYSPEAEKSLNELTKNIETFSKIKEEIRNNWKSHNTMLAFCPDHGCHEIDGKLGSHGLDMPEDMNIIHMFSFIPKS